MAAKRLHARDIREYMICPKKSYYNKMKESWTEQAKLYLRIFSEAEKVLIVDKNGNILEEVKR